MNKRSPIRVAHFYSSLGIYGAERWAITLLKYVDRRRVTPMIVTVGGKAGSHLLHELAAANGYETYHIDVPGKLNPRAIIQLRKLLIEKHIDILHTHGFKSDVLGYFASRGLPLRLVSTPHGWSAEEGVRIGLYEAIGRMFLRRFDKLYPLSTALLNDLQDRGFASTRLHLVRNAVDSAPFDAYFQSRTTRAVTDPFRILFAGRLCKPKGVSFLIQAMAKASLTCVAELHIAGDGPDRNALQQLTRDLNLEAKVRFLGVTGDMAPLLAASDVLVLPSYCQGSRCEGIPRIIMEAFSAGTPVIGTSIPGIRELIDHENTGLLVPVGDAEALARALERVAAAPTWGRGMAMRARTRVEEAFSAARLARELEAEYEQLVPSSDPPIHLFTARSHS